MDELFYIDLLDEMENAEDREEVDGPPQEIMNIDPFLQLNNHNFQRMFRLTKDLTLFLIGLLQPLMRPQIKQTDLPIPIKVLVALRFFASGSYQLDIGSNNFLNISQSSVSRCLKEVVEALNHPNIFNQWVSFPGTLEALNVLRQRFFTKYNFPGIIGCIDCTHVAIFPPRVNDPNYPEYLYVNRKGYHSINVQLICDSNLKVINVNARYPGSTNDAFIWNNSNVQTALRNLHAAGNTDYYLLGDSGYPLRTWLMTPLEDEPVPGSPEYVYNVTHKSIRSIIERCNGVLKMRFRCLLKHRVLHYSPQFACKIINACVVLHNLCIDHGVEDRDLDENLGDFEDVPEALPALGRINPELAEGRRARQRVIHNVFRNI